MRAKVDQEYAREQDILDGETQDNALNDFETKLASACTDVSAIKVKQDASDVISTQTRITARNKQRIANRSAEKNGLENPFPSLVPTSGIVPAETWQNICE